MERFPHEALTGSPHVGRMVPPDFRHRSVFLISSGRFLDIAPMFFPNSESSRAKAPKRKFPSESSQAKVPKRKFPSERSQAKVPKRIVPSESSKRQTPSESSHAKYPNRKLSSKSSQVKAKVPKRKIPSESYQAKERRSEGSETKDIKRRIPNQR